MKVLVLGGTGAIGMHLISILSKSESEICVTSRRERRSEGNVKYIKGNAHESDFLDTLLITKWDVIVDFMVYSTNEFRGCFEKFLKSTKQYIYISSCRVFAPSQVPINEESPRLLEVCQDEEYLKTDEYALAKARQEDILHKSGFKNWTIIRPSVTFGENRLQLGELEKEFWLYRALLSRTIVLSRDIISKYTTLTYGYDVSKGISEVVGKQKALGEIYNITTSESHKWEEILLAYLDIIESRTGKRPKVLILDKAPIPGRYVVKYDKLYDRQYDNHKISDYVDSKSFSPTLLGLKKCMETFLDNKTFLPIDFKKEAFFDRITGELTPLSEIQTIKSKIVYLLYRYFISYRFIYKMHQIVSRYGK